MEPRVITPQYEVAAAWLRARVLPWRKLTIAIDGVDHAGKSSLGRFLAWQLGMPLIEADLALRPDADPPAHDIEFLGRLIRDRHERDWPVLIEGVFVLRALDQLAISPEYVIGVQARGRTGSAVWQCAFRKYCEQFPRANAPDHKVEWVPTE